MKKTCDHFERNSTNSYCFTCVCDRARKICIERGEGWRWGVKE